MEDTEQTAASQTGEIVGCRKSQFTYTYTSSAEIAIGVMPG